MSTRRLLITGLALSFVGCGSNTATLVINVDICRNPSFTEDGFKWTTEDTIPDSVKTGSEIHGQLVKEGANTATFRSDDGLELRYQTSGEFGTLKCIG